MKNKMSDVRDHLVARMEELGEADAGANAIERAKGTALLAGQFIAAVKVEIDARRLLGDDVRDLPPALEPPERAPLRAIGNGPRK